MCIRHIFVPMPGPKDLPERKVQRCATNVTGPVPTCEGNNDIVIGQWQNNISCFLYWTEQIKEKLLLKTNHLFSMYTEIISESY